MVGPADTVPVSVLVLYTTISVEASTAPLMSVPPAIRTRPSGVAAATALVRGVSIVAMGVKVLLVRL